MTLRQQSQDPYKKKKNYKYFNYYTNSNTKMIKKSFRKTCTKQQYKYKNSINSINSGRIDFKKETYKRSSVIQH